MPTPPGYSSVSVQLQKAGMTRPSYITFGVDHSGTDPAAVATAVNNAIVYAGSLVSILDNSVTIPAIRVSMGTDGSTDIVHVGTFATVGAATLSSLPPNCAVLVHKGTARGGRRGRGRLFLPWCVAITDVDEAGIIATSAMTSRQNAMNAFLTQLAVQTVPMVLIHDQGLTAPGAPDLVTYLNVDKLISTQRRRLGR
jgi:hypothetical protein